MSRFEGRETALAASTIRLIHSNHITCCVDEAESLGRASDENVQALLGIYNSGYKQGAKLMKCGQQNKVELFESYSPKAFGGIAALNDTTASRCITLIMPPVKNRQNFNREVNSRDKFFMQLRDQLYIHMLTDFEAILETYSELESPSEAMNGRDWEMWKPLITLAKAIDPMLCETITVLALAMTKRQKSSDFSAEDDIEFLTVVSLQLENFPDYLPVQKLKDALLETASDTFIALSENYGNNNRWIGSWLKRLDLVHSASIQKKIGGFNLRCYKMEKLKVLHRLDALKG